MRKKNLLKKAGALLMVGTLAFSSLTAFAANSSGANGSNDSTSSEKTDVDDSDIINSSKTGSISLYKYDMSSAEANGFTFNYNSEDYKNTTSTDSTMTTGSGSTITITATGEDNAEARAALSDYAVQGIGFKYLRVGDVRTYTDNGSVKLIYGIDDDLRGILGLDTSAATTSGTETGGTTTLYYYTSQEIINALSSKLSDNDTTDESGNNISTKDALEAYMASHNGTAMPDTDSNGYTTVSGLDLGLYLVTEYKVTENIVDSTNPFFVQLPFTSIDGTEWKYDYVALPKNLSGHPDLDKLVRDANESEDGVTDTEDTYTDTATASEGDVLEYILVSKLPNVTSTATYLTEYTFIDTLSDGLKYNGDLTIYIYNNEADAKQHTKNNVAATWTQEDVTSKYFTTSTDSKIASTAGGSTNTQANYTVVKTELSSAGIELINTKYNANYGTYYIVLAYTATLESNSTTTLGDEGNPNDVTLVWSRTNQEYFNTLEDEAIVYSYAIDLTKEFSDGSKKFEDVQFVLYNEEDDYYVVASETTAGSGLYYVTGTTANKADATVFTPNSDGKLVINGLEADEYKLTEIATADGFSLLENQVTIDITATVSSIEAASVGYLNQEDYNQDYIDQTIDISNNTQETTKEEGTTSKTDMVAKLIQTAASATVDGEAATMCNYGSESISATLLDGAGDSADAAVVMTILNSKGFTLPQTGGAGLYLICILGVVVVVAGCYSFRRKKNVA